MKSKYSVVRTFRNGVAPALTWNQKWIFVDKDLNRINDYQYISMDPVLRNGIYYVRIGDHKYGAACYDGKPIIDEWFDYPIHFENGFAQCCRLHLDENGDEIKLSNGQPLYDYGILGLDGKYLFPLIFSTLNWNDYKEKNCWFAEDDNFCYLLFRDGSKRTYRKSCKELDGLLYRIPPKEYNNNITEDDIENTYHPQVLFSENYTIFNVSKYFAALTNWTGEWAYPLHFYYRDTDAVIDVKKLYKKGSIIRCGSIMEVTDKLLRPVCKTRFLIASRGFYSRHNWDTRYIRNEVDYKPIDFSDFVIHPNACFVVLDVMSYANMNQVLLLNIPYGAAALAKKHKLKMSNIKPIDKDGIDLKTSAKKDFQDKMNKSIHGYSLSNCWLDKMYQPIGLSIEMQPVTFEKDYTATKFDYIDTYSADYEWNEQYYMKEEEFKINVVVGDITKMQVDAIVNAANTSLLGGGGVDGAIHRAAGKELLEECKLLNGCSTGESKMTNGYNLQCKNIIHTVGPIWKDGKSEEAKLLASCYNTCMKLAEKNNLKSIAFPCISTGVYNYPKVEAAEIAISTIYAHLKYEKYKGEIYFCCFNQEDAKIYKVILSQFMSLES